MQFLEWFENIKRIYEQHSFHMTQYGDSTYLQILLIALLPAVILAAFKIRLRLYGLFLSTGMIFLLIWLPGMGMKFFIVFCFFEVFLILLYSFIRQKTTNKYLYFLFLFLSMCPLIIGKISPVAPMPVVGFLGLSYMNFKTIQIIIGLYDGTIKKINIFTLICFITFFPTLSSGPIIRYLQFENDLNNKIPVKEYFGLYLPTGIRKIIMGIGYKFVIAYLINEYWLTKIPEGKTVLTIFSYMYAYGFYLFFDFAGYSNFAIGTSYILGVKAPENFNMPFASKDIKEFWTRWHITLSKWFGDFLYSRIVMNFLRKKWLRNRHLAGHIATFTTMLVMGFWHGLQLHYIVYGAFHGFLLVATDIYQRKSNFYKKNKNKFVFELANVFVTFHLVFFGFLIFSGYLF